MNQWIESVCVEHEYHRDEYDDNQLQQQAYNHYHVKGTTNERK